MDAFRILQICTLYLLVGQTHAKRPKYHITVCLEVPASKPSRSVPESAAARTNSSYAPSMHRSMRTTDSAPYAEGYRNRLVCRPAEDQVEAFARKRERFVSVHRKRLRALRRKAAKMEALLRKTPRKTKKAAKRFSAAQRMWRTKQAKYRDAIYTEAPEAIEECRQQIKKVSATSGLTQEEKREIVQELAEIKQKSEKIRRSLKNFYKNISQRLRNTQEDVHSMRALKTGKKQYRKPGTRRQCTSVLPNLSFVPETHTITQGTHKDVTVAHIEESSSDTEEAGDTVGRSDPRPSSSIEDRMANAEVEHLFNHMDSLSPCPVHHLHNTPPAHGVPDSYFTAIDQPPSSSPYSSMHPLYARPHYITDTLRFLSGDTLCIHNGDIMRLPFQIRHVQSMSAELNRASLLNTEIQARIAHYIFLKACKSLLEQTKHLEELISTDNSYIAPNYIGPIVGNIVNLHIYAHEMYRLVFLYYTRSDQCKEMYGIPASPPCQELTQHVNVLIGVRGRIEKIRKRMEMGMYTRFSDGTGCWRTQ